MIEKKYYHISEVAQECGVSKSTIKTWERNSNMKHVKRELNGYRKYTDEQRHYFVQLARFNHMNKFELIEYILTLESAV